jgi:hypothetical protein
MRYYTRSIALAAGMLCPTATSCEPMSLSSRVSPSVRPSRASWRLAGAWVALVLSACSPVAGASATPGLAKLGLSASSSAVCEAMAALPDLSAAERTFTNVAHEALHGLAADPRLDRSMSARVLEAMERVEADFSRSADAALLSNDLGELHGSADAALRALGEEVPACER